jgi:hypothetical protein
MKKIIRHSFSIFFFGTLAVFMISAGYGKKHEDDCTTLQKRADSLQVELKKITSEKAMLKTR